ncbi:hypothetical protein [uncultured Methylobacterium sp.]|uniref:hypothetical protein n=1 Tax=uncultured Methylobacterium sp. TaxID=157278 RepID=UPI0035CA3555
MTTRQILRRLALAAAPLALAGPAWSQAAVQLDGTCETLVIAGQDATAACKGVLGNTAERRRTTFDFSTADGRTLSFSGTGAQQERTEDTDPLQPINLVTTGTSSEKGVVRNPLPAVGACRFSTPAPGRTAITCEATASDSRAFAGTFVTQAKAAPGAPAQ